MKKILSLLAILTMSVITGCSEDGGANTGVAPVVINKIDVSSSPIEVGEISDATYTLRIANPFDNATDETKDYAKAIVRVKYNDTELTNFQIGHTITNGNIVILSSTCGTVDISQQNIGTYGTIPSELEKGQSCEIAYKLTPQGAFVHVDKITVEYFKKSYFYDPKEGQNPDMNVLTAEALIEKAKTANAYQLSETILKIVGKKGEIAGTEENHIFNKNTGLLENGTEYIIEYFEAVNNDTTYKINFLNTDSNTSTIPFKLFQTNMDSETKSDEALTAKISPKLDIETQLATFYTFDFNSENGKCIASSNNTTKVITVNCSKGGKGELKIGLKIGKDNYYKEKYLKEDKAYYITETENKETPVTPSLNNNIYMYLSKTLGNNGLTYTYNAKCWTDADVDTSTVNTNFTSGSGTNLTVVAKTIYYNNTIFPTISATEQEYVTVTGTCGDNTINMIYSETDFIVNGKEPTATTDFTDGTTVNQGKIKFNKDTSIPSISNEESEEVSLAYIVLEKMVTNRNESDTTNMDLNARCYLPEDRFNYNNTYYFDKIPRKIENLELKQYSRNNFSYNTDGTLNIKQADYVLLTGTCGNIELATEYPLSDFKGKNYANYVEMLPNTKPNDVMNSIQLYYLLDPQDEIDGAIRHNLLAR